jgi:hypothetical protein
MNLAVAVAAIVALCGLAVFAQVVKLVPPLARVVDRPIMGG